MSESNKCVKGYKIFNPNWKCRNKQYECCAAFEEDLEPILYERGMHFCFELRDCFLNYPMADETYHYAEVIAYGDIDSEYPIVCTNKMLIVREIPYDEVMLIVPELHSNVNIGKCNKGHMNTGMLNCGSYNSGRNNYGSFNTGSGNEGDCNVGEYNDGSFNTGGFNIGDFNTGSSNWGDWNSGRYNRGQNNSGNCNTGNHNSGDYNHTNYSSGIFNTVENTIMMFNKPSDWTYEQWLVSDAYFILDDIMYDGDVPTKSCNYDDEPEHSESKYTYFHVSPNTDYSKCQAAWQDLNWKNKVTILSLPNFDPDIFKECTGIDTAADWAAYNSNKEGLR